MLLGNAAVFQVYHEPLQFAYDQLVVVNEDCAQTLGASRNTRQCWTPHWPLLVQTEHTKMKIVLKMKQKQTGIKVNGGWTLVQKDGDITIHVDTVGLHKTFFNSTTQNQKSYCSDPQTSSVLLRVALIPCLPMSRPLQEM